MSCLVVREHPSLILRWSFAGLQLCLMMCVISEFFRCQVKVDFCPQFDFETPTREASLGISFFFYTNSLF